MCIPVRAVCKPHSPDLKKRRTDVRGCSLWHSLLERPPPAPESRVRVSWCGPGGVTPAYSPDMSPIEHVWDAVDRRI